MQSNKANAVWASQTSSQTVGVNNWTQYQLSLTGSALQFNINSTPTTSTNLQYYMNQEGVDINPGDTILLSTNGTSFTSGTAGAVSFVGPTSTIQNMSNAAAVAMTYQGFASAYSLDGTKLYVCDTLGKSVQYTVYQYTLSTPFDLTTMTYSGKSWTIPLVGGQGFGFTFKTDGSILYVVQTLTVYAYALTTAWDISTASTTASGTVTLTKPQSTGIWAGSSGYSAIKFSPDGTRLICGYFGNNQNSGNTSSNQTCPFALYTLSVPWAINTCATTTTNYSTVNTGLYTYNNYFGFIMSPDGTKILIISGRDYNLSGSPLSLIVQNISLGTAWNFTTLIYNGYTGLSAFGNTTGTVYVAFMMNANGTSLKVNASGNGSPAYGLFATTGTLSADNYGKYNVNISGFGLGAAPVAAFTAAPTVRVNAETTAARVNLFPYQVYQASSTTSQAVIYKPTSGYVAANDTILLNGTTSVTVTSVTEGTNLGVAAIPITTAANRTYASKAFTLPTASTAIEFNIRISPDGSTMIAGLRNGTYGAGLYQYTLTTPWDINTATFANKFVAVTADSNAMSASSGTVTFDVVPDGSRLVLLGSFITGSATSLTTLTAREYTMSQAWDIGTLRPTGVTWNTTLNCNTTYTANCIRFVPNGSQLVYVTNDIYSGGSSTYIYYTGLGTPYRISTAGIGPGTLWESTNTGGGNVRSVTFTPDGLNIITQGGITTSNTFGTANNMATATKTNNPNSATTKWAWPAGTMGSSNANAWGGEFSPDGTKYYVISGDGVGASVGWNNIWQFNVMVIPQTSYTCNFATQGSAPTSVVIPDRSVAQTITTTLASGTMTFASPTVATNARGIATKITSPGAFTTITNATLNMWRS